MIDPDFAHFAAHAAPDAAVEAMTAVCRTCDQPTPGTWQHAAGGRRIRTPSEHPGPDRRTCHGSFAAAELVKRKKAK